MGTRIISEMYMFVHTMVQIDKFSLETFKNDNFK